MHFLATILFFFLMSLNGYVNQSISIGKECSKTDSIVFVDSMEANLMNLYNAAAETRHAVQQESTVCTPGFSVRVLPNRTRTVSNVSISGEQKMYYFIADDFNDLKACLEKHHFNDIKKLHCNAEAFLGVLKELKPEG